MVFKTLDKNNSALCEEYSGKDKNYLVIINPVKNNLCYIYCSSNSLYQKDNEESFISNVIENNRYEWQNRRASIRPKKEIFIRDIWLSWYVRGINSEYNTIEKLVSFLKLETKGYETVVLGVSSGGFIASIIATEIQAAMCIDFSGQFSLVNHFDHMKNNPFLREADESTKKYLESYNEIGKSDVPIYYLFPGRCEQDKIQFQYARNCKNVRAIQFFQKSMELHCYL